MIYIVVRFMSLICVFYLGNFGHSLKLKAQGDVIDVIDKSIVEWSAKKVVL